MNNIPQSKLNCQDEALPVVAPGKASLVKKNRRDKGSAIRQVALRSYRLKHSGNYVHYMQHYLTSTLLPYSLEAKYDGFGREDAVEHCTDKLGRCWHTWRKESKGKLERFRGMGCGERAYCPLCGSYVQITLSREASETMMLAQEAIELNEVKLEHYGLRVVLPLYKVESERIDALLIAGQYGDWKQEVTKIFRMADNLLKRWFGKGIGSVLSLDFSGESAPTEPHYHINAYVFPCELKRGQGLSFSPLKAWYDDAELKAMRDGWRDSQNKAYGLALSEADVNIGYLKNKARLYHWMRYLYRHSLSDIWRGWRTYDVESGVLEYEFGEVMAKQTLSIPVEALERLYQRLDMIPKNFKRVRWFGVFADGVKGKTMENLGLEKRVLDADDDGESKEWEIEGYYSLIKLERGGGLLLGGRYTTGDNYGQDDGTRYRVESSLINWKPYDVKVGKRIKWVAPGG